MRDLERYIEKRKKQDKRFAYKYEEGYEKFKIGVLIKQLREQAGLTQEELAKRIHTKKSAISRLERHGKDIKISTLLRIANSLGKKIQIKIE